MKKCIFVIAIAMSVASLCVADNSLWTFDSDIEGWNSAASTWNTTIAHDAVEFHDAAGSIKCTDSDVWCGVRNTVTIGAEDLPYEITAWTKLVAISEYGLGLNTYDLDKDNPGGTNIAFDDTLLGTWQSKTLSGQTKAGVSGYIMINSTAPWDATDPATNEFYLDDISYTESSSVSDWSLYANKP